MAKLGEGTSPRCPSPATMARASVVLPAPRPPVRATTSSGRRRSAMALPKRSIAARSGRSTITAGRWSRQVDDRRRPLPRFGQKFETPAVRLDQLARQRQAQALAALGRLAAGADLDPAERAGERGGVHAGTVVGDDD